MPDAAGPTIVIAGTREDWPGGPRTLTPRDLPSPAAPRQPEVEQPTVKPKQSNRGRDR